LLEDEELDCPLDEEEEGEELVLLDEDECDELDEDELLEELLEESGVQSTHWQMVSLEEAGDATKESGGSEEQPSLHPFSEPECLNQSPLAASQTQSCEPHLLVEGVPMT